MATAHESAPALKIVGILVAVVLALFLLVALLLLLFVRSEAFEAQVRERVLPMVSERLGREVTVESVEGAVFPSPHVRLTGLRIAGKTEAPTFRSDSVEAGFHIWPLLTSAGKRMVLDRLIFEGPIVNLVRLPNGEWDIPRPPPSERQMEVDLQSITLEEGSLNLLDSRGRSLLAIDSISGGASFVNSALDFRALRARAYGARIDAGGSRIDLGADPMLWNLDLSAEDLLLQSLPSRIDPMRGKIDFALALSGEDVVPARMGRTATGSGEIEGKELIWRTLDLRQGLAQSLGGLLEEAGLPIVTRYDPAETELGGIESGVSVRNGWIELNEPLGFDSPAGPSRIGGRWRLGAQLDLEGQTELSEDFVSAFTRGELSPDAPVPIRYRIRGSFDQPKIEEVDASAFVPLLAEEGAQRLRRGLEDLLPPLGTP